MKREHQEESHQHYNGFHNPMFSKRHHHEQLPPPHLHSSTVTRFFPTMEEEEEEEEDSHRHSPIQYYSTTGKDVANDGGSIEVVRRPRGRPPGSKNRTTIVAKESSEPSMSPYILEIPAGVDIIEATTRFCRKRKIGLCILAASGAVTNITLKQPSSTTGATVTFHGRFDILSISATILASSGGTGFTGDGLFTLSVGVGPQGQVVGGVVIGPLISAAITYLIAGTFTSPSFSRLRHDENGESPAEDCGIGSLYSFDEATDVMWAPNSKGIN